MKIVKFKNGKYALRKRVDIFEINYFNYEDEEWRWVYGSSILDDKYQSDYDTIKKYYNQFKRSRFNIKLPKIKIKVKIFEWLFSGNF